MEYYAILGVHIVNIGTFCEYFVNFAFHGVGFNDLFSGVYIILVGGQNVSSSSNRGVSVFCCGGMEFTVEKGKNRR